MEAIEVSGGHDVDGDTQDTEATLQQYTDAIRQLARATADNIIRIGRILFWGHTNLSSARFHRWVRGELGWTLSQAGQYIRVYQRFGDLDLSGVQADPHALFLLSRFELGTVPVQEARGILQAGEPLYVSDAYALEEQNPSAEVDEKIARQRDLRKEIRERIKQNDSKTSVAPVPLHPRPVERHEIPAHQLWIAMQHLQVMLVECYHMPLRSPVARALASFQALLPPIKLDTIGIVVVTVDAEEDS